MTQEPVQEKTPWYKGWIFKTALLVIGVIIIVYYIGTLSGDYSYLKEQLHKVKKENNFLNKAITTSNEAIDQKDKENKALSNKCNKLVEKNNSLISENYALNIYNNALIKRSDSLSTLLAKKTEIKSVIKFRKEIIKKKKATHHLCTCSVL